MSHEERKYASRAGLKLEAALAAFGVEAGGYVCVDFGSHVGGFVDCLLSHGAAKVYAVEPGYGVLDYRLRKDPRVTVRERTNAVRFVSPERCDLATVDVGWTPQRLVLPAARRALKAEGSVITLIKPHYEAPKEWLERGVLAANRLDEVLEGCRRDIAEGHWRIAGEIRSPLEGHGGNVEFLWHLRSEDAAWGED